jgi:hypothetical protein
MTDLGHEEQLPPPRLSGCCRFSQGTFAGAHGNGRDAPFAAVRRDRQRPQCFDEAVVRSRCCDQVPPIGCVRLS